MKLVENPILRGHILTRLKQLSMTDSALLTDLEERGMPINASRWSKYKNNKKGQITDEQLMFISVRLGIRISLNFGVPQVVNGKIVYTIPKYSETESITLLKRMFPDIKK